VIRLVAESRLAMSRESWLVCIAMRRLRSMMTTSAKDLWAMTKQPSGGVWQLLLTSCGIRHHQFREGGLDGDEDLCDKEGKQNEGLLGVEAVGSVLQELRC
jgi:hypothetical protein